MKRFKPKRSTHSLRRFEWGESLLELVRRPFELRGVDPELVGTDTGVRAWIAGQAAIRARLDNGEIDGATAEKLLDQVEVYVKTVARRAGKVEIDAILAETEARWKEKGHAPPAEVLGWLAYAAHRLPPELVTTLHAGVSARLPKMSVTEGRHTLVCFCRDFVRQPLNPSPDAPAPRRLTWRQAYEAAAEISKGTPFEGGRHAMEADYKKWERGQPRELRRNPKGG
jgi:hypothetical protein